MKRRNVTTLGSSRIKERAVVLLQILVALIVLVGMVTGDVVFAAALAAIWGFVFFCSRYTRKVDLGLAATQTVGAGRPRVAAGLRYNLCAFGVLYLVPIGIATAFYVLLASYINFFGDSLSIDWLITMQRTFERISTFFANNLKLKEATVLIVLAVVYILSCVLLSRWGRARRRLATTDGPSRGMRIRLWMAGTLHRVVDVYCKYSGPLAAGLATLASFTFFGMHLGEPSQDLQLRIKVAQQGYSELVEKAEADLSERVATELYAKVRDSFPPSYREALGLPTQIDSLVVSVQTNVELAQRQYGVRVPPVEQMLEPEKARIGQVGALKPEWRVSNERPRELVNGARLDMPGSATPNEVKAARAAFDSRPKNKGTEIIREGQKKIFLQAEKLVSERLVEFTKPMTSAIPILEPLLQSFVEVADKTLQERMEKAYEGVAEAVTRNPSDLENIVEREAKAVVADTDVRGPVERATPLAEQRGNELRQTVSRLGASSSQIDDHIGKKLLNDLASPDESTRTRAAQELAGFNRLSSRHVADLVSLMRTGSQSWSKSYRPPGGHCTDITTTSIRYYAADAIDNASSPHATPEMRNEATAIKSSARTTSRVYDPGWICYY